jgi:hypothetical protein
LYCVSLGGGGGHLCASASRLLIFGNIIIMMTSCHRVAYGRFSIPDADAEKIKVLLVFKGDTMKLCSLGI